MCKNCGHRITIGVITKKVSHTYALVNGECNYKHPKKCHCTKPEVKPNSSN